ncbi:MAG: hypothetical protein ACI8X5_000188 [Planctomycetota bacterium]|jgi:hypothetical protein
MHLGWLVIAVMKRVMARVCAVLAEVKGSYLVELARVRERGPATSAWEPATSPCLTTPSQGFATSARRRAHSLASIAKRDTSIAASAKELGKEAEPATTAWEKRKPSAEDVWMALPRLG